MAPLPASFHGWPPTKLIPDRYNPSRKGVAVEAHYLTPGAASAADAISMLFVLAMIADMAVLSFKVETLEFVAGAILGGIGFWYIAHRFFQWLFSRDLTVEMFENTIVVPHPSRPYDYPRKIDHVFKTREDVRAAAEELRWRQQPKMRRYYADSWEVILEHNRQEILLALVYPRRRAEALVNRLNGIDNAFDMGMI